MRSSRTLRFFFRADAMKGAAAQKRARARRSYFLPPRSVAQDRLPVHRFRHWPTIWSPARGMLGVPGVGPDGRTGERADLAAGRTAAAARPMHRAGRGTAVTRRQRTGAWAPGPAHVKRQAVRYLYQNDSRQFDNPGKCSKIKNVAPDPGSCIRVEPRLHGRAPEFFRCMQQYRPGRRSSRDGGPRGRIILPPGSALHN